MIDLLKTDIQTDSKVSTWHRSVLNDAILLIPYVVYDEKRLCRDTADIKSVPEFYPPGLKSFQVHVRANTDLSGHIVDVVKT